METALLLQPDTQSLSLGLRSVLGVSNAGELTILDRERNAYSSGSLSEIVTCRCADGRALRLLVKYAQYPDAAHYRHLSHEPFIVRSWSNVPYEAEVYRHVLEPLRLSTPKFYGTYQEPGSGRLWLILEYFENAIPLDELFDDSHMGLAANWLGRFHAANEHRVATASLSFLKKLDAGHYSAFATRALSHAGRLDGWFSWLPDLCSRFEDLAASMWTLRPTITHGDYYRNNILLRDGNIHPVDWEQAAIDLGEMDLACLTYRWPANITQWCELEYQRSRWPQGSPDDFETVLTAARLVLYLDEIRNLPNWAARSERLAFSQEMRSLGERLGLI
jgi:aminoglycoside phosphotransferase (APT) family kinase protein